MRLLASARGVHMASTTYILGDHNLGLVEPMVVSRNAYLNVKRMNPSNIIILAVGTKLRNTHQFPKRRISTQNSSDREHTQSCIPGIPVEGFAAQKHSERAAQLTPRARELVEWLLSTQKEQTTTCAYQLGAGSGQVRIQ